MKLLALLFIFFTFSIHPIFAQNQTLRISTFLAYYSKHFLDLENSLRSYDKGTSKFNIEYDRVNTASQLAFNYDEYNNFTLDGSYLQYTKGIATVGIGKVDRHWSFSKNTSLILSNNAPPSESIYLKLDDKLGYDWSPSKAHWSLEVFNGFTDGSLNGSKSMLIGMRAILSPVEGLDFELIQTSQWGGNEYNNGISSLGAALFFNSNDGSNKNVNKMAGFGISYLIPSHIMPLRIYGQAIGEDEAGNLPSCFAYLAGLEWTNTKNKYPTIVGIEAIDTRIDVTTNGNCGPNTMYNNSTYDYTNYGKTMGAAIDTEGTSLALYVRSQISQRINIEFATKSVVINDNNWSGHRLSTKRQSGLINSLGVSLVKNNISFNGDIYYQGFNIDKANIKSGYGLGFSSSIIF
ncbi:capsule assembly Wzi family protein [Amylibacter sp.]|nr:capsule assembly Wzi family protein [Amylibacter sp.]